MARIHLVVGPVGAGKSTFVRRLCKEHRAVQMNLDEWMAQLFSKDRPPGGSLEWDIERTHRCIEQLWKQTLRTLEAGTDVVLEIGLILRHDRERLCARVDLLRIRERPLGAARRGRVRRARRAIHLHRRLT